MTDRLQFMGVLLHLGFQVFFLSGHDLIGIILAFSLLPKTSAGWRTTAALAWPGRSIEGVSNGTSAAQANSIDCPCNDQV